jgi:hypothetical protein
MSDSGTSSGSAGNVEKCRRGFYVLQQMNCTLPLSSCNRYAILNVNSVEENSTPPSDPTDEPTIAPNVQSTPTTPSHPIYPPYLKRWVLCKYVVTSTPSKNSIHLKVEIITMDTQQLISVMALLDCGATGLFVDKGFVDQNRITTRILSHPIPVYNIDGTWNEAGSICEVVNVILHYKDHSEQVQFTVTGLRKQDVILGYTWLKDHRGRLDYKGGQNVTLSWLLQYLQDRDQTGTSSTPNGSPSSAFLSDRLYAYSGRDI